MENWVLCRIFLKKRSSKNEDESTQLNNGPVFYDFLAKERADLNLTPVCSSSGSSGITEVSCHELDDHEEENSSCFNSLSSSFRRKP